MRKTLSLLFTASSLLVAAAGCGDDDDGGFRFNVPDGGPDMDGGVDGGPARECTDESRGSTIGESCLRNVECDDGCFCNGFEVCRGGTCDVGPDPCEDGFDCTSDSCDEDADVCANVPDDTVCDDSNICNGTEVCDPEIGCAAGPPATCSDADPCTLDLCDDETGACAFPIRDLDGDGFAEGQRGCGGDDCDDNPLTGADINPGATEDCFNEIDDDCDLAIDLADDECAPANGTCDSAVEIASSGDDLFWTSNGLPNNFDLGCDGATNDYDAVFSFTLTEASDVTARISGGGTGQAIAIRPAASCADATTEIECDSGFTTTPGELELQNFPAGDYVLIASVRTVTFFTVTVEVGPPTLPPATDTCDPMRTPIIPNDATTTYTLEWGDHEDDFDGPECADLSTSGGVEAVYQISITEPKDVRLEAEDPGSSVSLYVLDDCTDLETISFCDDGTGSVPPSIFARPLPAGDYFVVIEKAFSGTGEFTFTATIEEPVPRVTADVCATAPDITDGSSTIDISTLERDDGLGCDGDRAVFKDAYFEIDLAEAKDVTIETDGDGFHLLSFADGVCGDATAETLCRAAPSTATETFRNLSAGLYYVAVGTARTMGDLVVSSTLSDPTPPPSNDECSGARVIMDGASITASSVAATDSVTPSCGSAGSLDTWYEFTLAADSDVILTATPADGDLDDAVIELREGCSDTPIVCEDGDPATISRSLTAGTYRVAVESTGGGEKEISLRLVVL